MSMSSSSSIHTTPSAIDHGGGTPITAIHQDIIQSHILNRLDGRTLASTRCASSQLLSLSNDDYLWKDICNSTWLSTTDPRVADAISAFSTGHRSFYSDAFPAVGRHCQSKKTIQQLVLDLDTSELISAVDIYFDGELIYSKVLVTETLSAWFLNTPFRVELLDTKETVATPLNIGSEGFAYISQVEERLRVSWILIDPVKKRAINVASQKAVEARRHWLTEDAQLRYATVVAAGGDGGLVQCGIVVTCGGNYGGEVRVREVIMQVEDMEGKIMTGMDSLRILVAAMEGRRLRRDSKIEKDSYEMFLKMKARCRERKQRREKGLDVVFVATGISIFFGIMIFFSKVLVTETLSAWFLNTPFRVELLDTKETVATPLNIGSEGFAYISQVEERLRVSWILIDPVKKRAINVASQKAVEARRHWLTEDAQLRYATVVAAGGDGGLVQCGIVVTCGGNYGGEVRVREVIMQVEDMEGKIMTGMDSLRILVAAMEGRRLRRDSKIEKDSYEMFLKMKARCRERKQRREKGLDVVFVATGISIFFGIMIFFLSRLRSYYLG
ncbi:hypothetical protein CDL12_06570 [Handroanthus impetiginosus]|uniref:F-box domain-containing protein n=1 Tax=Handroanthus impetiginosus TaxID=429701 RepID=A0A2G9HT70_9LAMI|nr:hypothetical protein CDL12_06570 [Handroanthus impetiginosus]